MKQATKQVLDGLSVVSSVATQKAISAICEAEGVPALSWQVMHAPLGTIGPALMLLAMCLGKCPSAKRPEDCDGGERCCKNPTSRINAQSLFFAALIVAHSIKSVSHDVTDNADHRRFVEATGVSAEQVPVGVETSFSVETVFEAMRAYRTLNDGADPSKFLDAKIVAAVHANTQGVEQQVAKLLKDLSSKSQD